MTKPLSEQVAELQELFDRVALECDQRGETIAELEAERDRLRRKVFTLVAGRSAARAKLDHMRDAAASWEGHCHEARAERDDLQRQVQEARDERDALRDLVDVLGKHVTIPSEWIRFKGMSDLRYKEPQPTGYADDDHQDAEVLQWHRRQCEPRLSDNDKSQTCRACGVDHDPVPRLTVHDLEVAPVASRLDRPGGQFVKAAYWRWESSLDGLAVTAEYLIANGWADATLTTPEQA